MRRRYHGGPMAEWRSQQAWGDDYQESNGRVAEQKQLQLKAHTQA
ncbi:unnamed protein product [Staurois parvus]|uniref:Uncharacterized protein n=1 Tax=Staurois parvus TaxID=386267 RepID=A0ABN9EGV7_9NEOB|nr:unnamed protein product [Staurois parvus]